MTVTHQLADGGVVVRDAVPSSDVVRVRFGDIDGLRALAAFAIVAYQSVRFAGLPPGTPLVVARLFDDASQGLTLFLVLSAFALAYPALAAMRADGAAYLDVGRYAVKRLLRVYPAYLIVLAFAAALHPLALLFGLPALASGTPPLDPTGFVRNAFLIGDGLGNDGFRAVELIARVYFAFPFALALWVRAPRVAILLAVGAAALDTFTGAHATGIGAVVPLVLGIVAADLRVGRARFVRFGLPIALALAAAWFLEPLVALLPGALAAPAALRIDPFWAIAACGVLAGISAAPPLERVLSFAPVRLAGAASYAISLVAMPIAAFAARRMPHELGLPTVAVVGGCAAAAVGFALWLGVDRWFGDDGLRRAAAEAPGAALDRVLAKVGAARVVLGKPLVAGTNEPDLHVVAVSPDEFYAPPPRPVAGDLAMFSTRSGSAEDLAAEILATKRRLTEQSSTFFTSEPEPDIVSEADRFEKPGFYRRTANPRPALTQGVKAPQRSLPPAATIAVPPPPAAPEPEAVPAESGPPAQPTPLFAAFAALDEADGADPDEPAATAPEPAVVTQPPEPPRPAIRMRIGPGREPGAARSECGNG